MCCSLRTTFGWLGRYGPINAFLNAHNAKDKTGAMKYVCPDATKVVTTIDKVLTAGTPQFHAEAVGLATQGFANAYLAGTLNGQPLPEEQGQDGAPAPKGRIAADNIHGPWCVASVLTGIPEIDGS